MLFLHLEILEKLDIINTALPFTLYFCTYSIDSFLTTMLTLFPPWPFILFAVLEPLSM